MYIRTITALYENRFTLRMETATADLPGPSMTSLPFKFGAKIIRKKQFSSPKKKIDFISLTNCETKEKNGRKTFQIYSKCQLSNFYFIYFQTDWLTHGLTDLADGLTDVELT